MANEFGVINWSGEIDAWSTGFRVDCIETPRIRRTVARFPVFCAHVNFKQAAPVGSLVILILVYSGHAYVTIEI